MTITVIKAIIAGYLKQTASDFTINGQDILLAAINSARRSAERLHDFRYAETTANLVISSTGGLITAATVSAAPISIKRIQNVLLPLAGGEYLPIEFMSDNEFTARIRRNTGRQAYVAGNTLAQMGVTSTNPIAYQQGQNIQLYPAAQFTFPVTVHLSVVRFMPDYTGGSDEDFFLKYAPEYIQWQSILELNKYWNQYVARQEGSVEENAVEGFAQEALQNLIQWDMSLSQSTSRPPVKPE